jgi:hypothetical protein|tara:strand:- start:7 stop:171 length:165 start_codon:yes stop_codon:yes gene_type:complete
MTMIFSMAKTDNIIKTVSPAKNEEMTNFLIFASLRTMGYLWGKYLSLRWKEGPE